jgi:hypothetical protein
MDSTQYPDTGPGRGGPGGSANLVACPECELPAEITDRFWLDSTDGPVLHVSVSCVNGHYFRMPADRLPIDVQPAPADAVAPDAGGHPAPASPPGFVRLPGRLGTVANLASDRLRAEDATASLA